MALPLVPGAQAADVLIRAFLKDKIKKLAIDFPADALDKILDDDRLLDGVDQENADIWAAGMVQAWKTGGQAAIYRTFAEEGYKRLIGSRPSGPRKLKPPNVLFSWKGIELALKVVFYEFLDRTRQNASIDLENYIIQLRDRFNAMIDGKTYNISDDGTRNLFHGLPAIPIWKYVFNCSLPQPSKGRKPCPKTSSSESSPTSNPSASGSSNVGSTSNETSTKSSVSSSVSTVSVESVPPFSTERRPPQWPSQILTSETERLVRETPLLPTETANEAQTAIENGSIREGEEKKEEEIFQFADSEPGLSGLGGGSGLGFGLNEA